MSTGAGDDGFRPTPQQIDAAVTWWQAAIQAPSFSVLSDAERARVDGIPMTVGEGLARQLADRHHPTPEQVARFGEVLRTHRSQTFDAFAFATLYVDYSVAGELREMAETAGVHPSVFPAKTIMEFRDGGVQVGCGYGQPFEDLL